MDPMDEPVFEQVQDMPWVTGEPVSEALPGQAEVHESMQPAEPEEEGEGDGEEEGD